MEIRQRKNQLEITEGVHENILREAKITARRLINTKNH